MFEISADYDKIKYLQEQVKSLQEEKEKLINDMKYLRTDKERLTYKVEQFLAELQEYEETQQNLKIDIKDLEKKLTENEVYHEKGGLKKMFLKFLESAFQQNKDAGDLLKILLTLFDCTEKEKAELTKTYQAKAKKGFLNKLF